MAGHPIASLAPPAAAVRRFEELSRTDSPYGGGGGANLGELAPARRGFEQAGMERLLLEATRCRHPLT